MWCSPAKIDSCGNLFVNIYNTLSLVDHKWRSLKLNHHLNWQQSTSAAKRDREVVPTMSVSKEKVETENILLQDYVVPSKEEEREKDAPALARNGDTPLMQNVYKSTNQSRLCST